MKQFPEVDMDEQKMWRDAILDYLKPTFDADNEIAEITRTNMDIFQHFKDRTDVPQTVDNGQYAINTIQELVENGKVKELPRGKEELRTFRLSLITVDDAYWTEAFRKKHPALLQLAEEKDLIVIDLHGNASVPILEEDKFTLKPLKRISI